MATTDATIASRSPQAVAITRMSTKYPKPAVVALTGIRRKHTKVVAAIRARATATRERTGTATPKKRLGSRLSFGLAAAIIELDSVSPTLHVSLARLRPCSFDRSGVNTWTEQRRRTSRIGLRDCTSSPALLGRRWRLDAVLDGDQSRCQNSTLERQGLLIRPG